MKFKEMLINYLFWILNGSLSLFLIIVMKVTYLKDAEVSIELLSIVFIGSWILLNQMLILMGRVKNEN